MTNIDIKIALHKYRPHDNIRRGRLELIFSGDDANDQLINGIGRIMAKRIPTYAFPPELIRIERINPETGYHDSIPFNHDMMRLRLSNFPVMNVDPGISFLHERYWKNIDYLDDDREKYDGEMRVEANIDAKNTASENDEKSIIHITTNDMKIYVNDKIVSLYDKDYPFLIISLKPKEAFKCSLKAVLGVGMRHSRWDACSNYWYNQETIPKKTIFGFESASRFDEFTLMERTLEYFKLRSETLREEIHRMYLLEKNQNERFIIVLKDEDHTMGEAINYELQSHPDILKSSNIKPDNLIREVYIDVVAFKKEKLLEAIIESINNLIKKIEKVSREFNKIDRSKIDLKFYNNTINGNAMPKKVNKKKN